MHDISGFSGLVALEIRRVLEGHPGVAGFGEGAHHARIELARLDLPAVELIGFGLFIGVVEVLAIEIGQVGNILGIEEGPHAVCFDAAHEEIGNPVGEIEIVGAPRKVAGVVAQLKELLNVSMPGLEIDAAGALSFAALVDRGYGAVECPEPGDDSVGETVGGADQRAL